MTTNRKANEAARECAFYFRQHGGSFEKVILSHLSVPQLFAIVEAADLMRCTCGHNAPCREWIHCNRTIMRKALTAYHTAQKENREGK